MRRRFSVGLLHDFRYCAGPVKVDIRIQIVAMELIHGLGMLGTDVAETQMFANPPLRSSTPPDRCRRSDKPRDLVCSISSFSKHPGTTR